MSTQTIPHPQHDTTPEVALEKLQAELKPCPFCGGRALLRQITDKASPEGEFVIAACDLLHNQCLVSPSAGADTAAEAVVAWNTRSGGN